jgi:hypothetical protein
MYADRGGTTSGPPFDHYEAKPGTMYAQADQILGKGKQVEGFSDSVVTAHRPAAAATHGFILPRIEGAPKPVRQRAQKVNQTMTFASGCVRYWGLGIKTFNDGVDKLNDEWNAAVADDFGLTKPTKPSATGTPTAGNVRAHDTYNEDLAAFNSQLSAKKAAKAKELRARFTKLETKLDNKAQKIAGMLKQGPDEKSIITLFGAGALPLIATTFFPQVDFDRADWRKALQALEGTADAQRLEDASAAEVARWLQQHPEFTEAVDWLLKNDGVKLTELQRSIIEGQAHLDAQILAGGDKVNIRDATVRLRLINSTAEQGGRINEAGAVFIDAWLDGVGPDRLTELPDEANRIELKPIADAILLRSNPDELESAASDESPSSTIQTLLETRIGSPSSNGRVPDADGDGQIDGLERFTGWSELLSASDATGGDEFSEALGRRAIQARQDMNATLVGVRIEGDGHVPQELRSLLEDDSAVSDLLSVTARNEDASSRLIIDDEQRHALLSMNWNDASGAADIVESGTNREPAGDDTSVALQRLAAKELMEDVARNLDLYRGFYDKETQTTHEGVMHEEISDAILDTGAVWGDTFLNPPSGTHDQQVDHGDIQLSREDQEAFLEFVGRDDTGDALRFQTGVILHSRAELTEALQNGDESDVQLALQRAGRFDGLMADATYDARLDQGDDEAQAARAADERTYKAAKITAQLAKAGAFAALPNPATAPGAVAVALASELTGQVIDSVASKDASESEYELARGLEELRSNLKNASPERKDSLILAAMSEVKDSDGDPLITKAEINDLGAESAAAEAVERYKEEYGKEIRDKYDEQFNRKFDPDDTARKVSPDRVKANDERVDRDRYGDAYGD